MGDTIREIKKALPDLDSKKVEDISDVLDQVLTIKRIFTSNDGKVLLKVLKDNCYTTLNKLMMYSKSTNPDLQTYISLASTYTANMDLLSQLQDIKIEEELRNQLDEAVKQAME